MTTATVGLVAGTNMISVILRGITDRVNGVSLQMAFAVDEEISKIYLNRGKVPPDTDVIDLTFYKRLDRESGAKRIIKWIEERGVIIENPR